MEVLIISFAHNHDKYFQLTKRQYFYNTIFSRDVMIKLVLSIYLFVLSHRMKIIPLANSLELIKQLLTLKLLKLCYIIITETSKEYYSGIFDNYLPSTKL